MLLSAELLAQGLGFFLLAYLARALGAEGFGVWTFATAVVTYLVSMVEAGTDSWGIREVSHDASRVQSVLGALLAVRSSIAVLAALAIFAYAVLGFGPVHSTRAWALVLGCLSIAAGALQTSWAYRAVERVAPVAASTVAQRAIALGLAFLLVRAPVDGPRAMLVQGASELTVALALLIGIRNLAKKVRPAWRGGLARRALREAWPMGASRMVRAAMVAFTVSVLAHTSTNATVGHYGAASRLVMALLTINVVFSMAVMPSIVRACARGDAGAGTIRAVHRLIAAIYLPIVVGGCLLAGPILVLLFGPDFEDSTVPLRLLLLALPFSAIWDNLRSMLVALGRQVDILRAVAGAAVVTATVALALSARFGAAGAASAVLAGEVTLFVIASLAVGRRGMRHPVLAPLTRPMLAAGLMGVVVQLVHGQRLPMVVAIGVVVYGVSLLAMRGITPDDLHALDAPAHAAESSFRTTLPRRVWPGRCLQKRWTRSLGASHSRAPSASFCSECYGATSTSSVSPPPPCSSRLLFSVWCGMWQWKIHLPAPAPARSRRSADPARR